VDIGDVGGVSSEESENVGPLPRDFKLQRSFSLSSLDTPPTSPMSTVSDSSTDDTISVATGKIYTSLRN
jgi:hypothetical protein